MQVTLMLVGWLLPKSEEHNVKLPENLMNLTQKEVLTLLAKTQQGRAGSLTKKQWHNAGLAFESLSCQFVVWQHNLKIVAETKKK